MTRRRDAAAGDEDNGDQDEKAASSRHEAVPWIPAIRLCCRNGATKVLRFVLDAKRQAPIERREAALCSYRARYADVPVDARDAGLRDEPPIARRFVIAVHLEETAIEVQRDGRAPCR